MATNVGLGFRLRLRARLLDAAGVGSVGLALATACGGRAESTDSGTAAGGASSGGQSAAGNGFGGTIVVNVAGGAGTLITTDPGTPLHACLPSAKPDAGTGGSGGASAIVNEAGMAGESSAGAAARGEPCPVGAAVPPLFEVCNRSAGVHVIAVEGGPVIEGGQCCYDLLVTYPFCGYVGRAFLVEGDMIKARARQGAGWMLPLSPQLEQLSPATRRALSAAWAKDGLFEHASVATFARFAIQLMSVGAPARLLHETLAAGRDEVRHAELCFALASAYAGEPLEPDAFPVEARLPIDRELVAIVAETVVEGCIGETLAALQAQYQLELTTDSAVRSALEATVEDETRHAELAWKVVAWAIREGGPDVRHAAQRAFSEFRAPPAPALELSDVNLEHFAAHGRLTAEQARAVAFEALETIVRPCAAGLFETDVFDRTPCTSNQPRAADLI